MRETGNDDLIWNRRSTCTFPAKTRMKTEQLGRVLGLTIDLHRIGARNSPEQAKNEIIQKSTSSSKRTLYKSLGAFPPCVHILFPLC